MPRTKIEAGTMLISEPFMLDAHFQRSAVLLCEHTGEGSLGFIVNRLMPVQLSELLDDFPEFDAPVHYGGPVATDTLHYIHSLGDLLDDCVELTPGIYWGGDFETLKFLIETQVVQPHQIRFYVGYSGWNAGQLYEELDRGSWVTARVDRNYIFNTPVDQIWQKILENKGDVYSVIAQMPDDRRLN